MFLNVSHVPRCHFMMLLFSFMFLILLHNIARVATTGVVKGRNGIVATDDKTCSKIGLDVLISGGHAVDAAVAATLCLGVKRPWDSGLGGGGFMIVRSYNKSKIVYDMREMAPRYASHDMYNNAPNYNGTGARSIAVPGQLAGLYIAQKEYGKKTWEQVVKPAKDLAEKGSKVPNSLYKSVVQIKKRVMADKEPITKFAPNGKILLKDKLRLKKLANTLSLIGRYGMDVFYNGLIGENLVKDIQYEGGTISMDDLRLYKVVKRNPLVAQALGFTIVTAPPPASGGAMMIMILKILAAYKDKQMNRSLLMHRTIEALKFALSFKMNLGDPIFEKNKILNYMISKNYTEKLKNRIKDSQTFDPNYYGSKWSQPQEEGTTHIVVIDKERNVVTMTTSINNYKGSQIMSPSTGIVLNNQMHDFSYPKVGSEQPPAPANFIKPYKRPLSSMTPTILLTRKDERVRAVIGAAGGLLIPDAVTEVLLNYFRLKMSPLEAISSPRFYHKLYPNILYYENRTVKNSQILDDLSQKGHVLQQSNNHHRTVCQFVVQHLQGSKSGLLEGVGDPRRGGIPAAY